MPLDGRPSGWDDLFIGPDRALFKAFKSLLSGQSEISDNTGAKRFLEACDKLAARKSPVFLVENLISHKNGIGSLSIAVRSDNSNDYLESVMSLVVLHLSHPQVKVIADGDILNRTLFSILSPPTFWYAILSYYRDNDFQRNSTEQFAWLCKEIVSTRSDELAVHHQHVADIMERNIFINSSSIAVRQIAYRIAKIIRTRTATSTCQDVEYSAGGRHDNDFVDFRDIALLPTSDEIKRKEPFLPQFVDVFRGSSDLRCAKYLEWLFRLLREDMLADLRESLAVAWGNKKGLRKPFSLGQLSLNDRNAFINDKWVDSFTLALRCDQPLFRGKMDKKAKEQFLNNTKGFLKNGSLGALCYKTDIIAFGSIVRDVRLLVKDPPIVVIKFASVSALRAAMAALTGENQQELRYYTVDTPVFAYEPILKRLGTILELPLEDLLLDPKKALSTYEPPKMLSGIIDILKVYLDYEQKVSLRDLIPSQSPITISGAQLESLINGLESPIGQIQGPPGTGKSFIGALIAQIILTHTDHRILVLSFTNHALDQFLEDLLDIGVSEADIVRLGSKFSARTAGFRLETQFRGDEYRFSSEINMKIRSLKEQVSISDARLKELSVKICSTETPWEEILDTLKFTDDEPFWKALQMPDDGFQYVGAKNRPMTQTDLLIDWARGRQRELPMSLESPTTEQVSALWTASPEERQAKVCQWTSRVREEQMDEYAELAESLHELRRQIGNLYNESKRNLLQSRRVIGCTTTGAAMYQPLIEAAGPDVVLVEEAGEILEAHIITALSQSVKKLVLIGDHKQLRPKINNYNLSVDKGEGFDLDVSLFERLIRQGHPYTTLREQHRSHPEISHFTRLLSYEKLKDSARSWERGAVRGIDKRVVFVHHEQPEEKPRTASDVGDEHDKVSKRNSFEADMVLKTVKYLSQQGYLTEDMVVLTPYLGQLSLLRDRLSAEHDPQLNDPDTNELVRAGLMTAAASAVERKPIRLSTIDNYQGEESNVVIASLTRSNSDGDIGFMHARERLTVLISRAREGIIMFGNMHTFMASKKGGDMWTDFMKALRNKECIFDGIPVHCERHLDQKALLKLPSDFDKHCPDGGCTNKCDVMLGCGRHTCQRFCHRVGDHSRIACSNMIENTCVRGHKTRRPCLNNNQDPCRMCASEDAETKFQNVNPGLSRHLAVDSPFVFHDFDIDVLKSILDMKLKDSRFKATGEAKGVALEVLARERNRPDFGNAGAIDNLLSKAKEGYQQRMSDGTAHSGPGGGRLEAIDFDENFDRASKASTNIRQLFAEEIDREDVVARLEYIQDRVHQLKSLNMDISDNVPFSFLFRGPPGTGKTMTARKMGKIYYDLGFLSAASVEKCSATDLIGQYEGHTGPKVQKLLDRALGRVLFIDEAYRLATSGRFGKEAVDELVGCMTQERYAGKLIIILAGYNDDINQLLEVNPGMLSRFPETVDFASLTPQSCVDLLIKLLGKKKLELQGKGKEFDIACLEAAREDFQREVIDLFCCLTAAEGWANARDVKQLSKSLFRKVDISQENVKLEEEQVKLELKSMLAEHQSRDESVNEIMRLHQSVAARSWRQAQATASRGQEQLQLRSKEEEVSVTTQKDEQCAEVEDKEGSDDGKDDKETSATAIVAVQPPVGIRDANVSDEVWEQLQRDVAVEEHREESYLALKKAEREEWDESRAKILRIALEQEEAQREMEAETKARLEAMGCCLGGYHWIKQASGYRCAGGSHWMSNEEIMNFVKENRIR